MFSNGVRVASFALAAISIGIATRMMLDAFRDHDRPAASGTTLGILLLSMSLLSLSAILTAAERYGQPVTIRQPISLVGVLLGLYAVVRLARSRYHGT